LLDATVSHDASVVPDASRSLDAAPDARNIDDGGPPPRFAGVATTEAITPTAVALTWLAASDESTDAGAIVYAVYVVEGDAGVPTSPHFVTNPGELGALVTRLERRKKYEFMVRARDASGNEDSNSVVVAATTLTSFELDVQPVFDRTCNLAGCHVPGNPPQGLILSKGFSYQSTVDRVAGEAVAVGEPNLKRVDSHSPDPDDSYLWRKIQEEDENAVIVGAPMLPEYFVPALTADERSIIKDWIVQGAKKN
jgi:hypothetical protein